jgi:Coenzyme PQQ synthesis protein D (PqqD)
MGAATITGETRISRTGDWLSADTGDGAVMMSPSATQYIGLSSTAGRIWELLETPRTLAELCTALAGEYQVTPDEVSGDVKEFVAGLAERGALALA